MMEEEEKDTYRSVDTDTDEDEDTYIKRRVTELINDSIDPSELITHISNKRKHDIKTLSLFLRDSSNPTEEATNLVDKVFEEHGIKDLTMENVDNVINDIVDNITKYMMVALEYGVKKTRGNPVGIIGIGCPGSGKTLPQLISMALMLSADNPRRLEPLKDALETFYNIIPKKVTKTMVKNVSKSNELINTKIKPYDSVNTDLNVVNDRYTMNKLTSMNTLKTRLERYLNRFGYIIIDQDDIIPYIFNLNEYRVLVYDLTELLFEIALEKHMNIIYASTGRDPNQIKQTYRYFKKSDYASVKLSIMCTPVEICEKQIKERFLDAYKNFEIGRYVPNSFLIPACKQITSLIPSYSTSKKIPSYVYTREPEEPDETTHMSSKGGRRKRFRKSKHLKKRRSGKSTHKKRY